MAVCGGTAADASRVGTPRSLTWEALERSSGGCAPAAEGSETEPERHLDVRALRTFSHFSPSAKMPTSHAAVDDAGHIRVHSVLVCLV